MTRKRQRILFATAVLVALTFWILLSLQGSSLSVARQLPDGTTTRELPANILAFEFAWSGQRAVEIVELWQANDLLDVARDQLRFDFVFLLLYPTAVALGCLLARHHLERTSPRLAALGRVLIPAQVLTAGFDAVENLALLRILRDASATTGPAPDLGSWAAAAAIFATLKFTLLLAGIVYGAAGLVAWLRHRD